MGFFPYFWIAIISELFSDGGVGGDEAQLPSNSSCFVSLGHVKLRWEDWSDVNTSLVRWLVAAIWLLLLLLLVRWVEWRNPRVSESQRAPGQLRQIPPGYPNEPFNNQGVSLFFRFKGLLQVTNVPARLDYLAASVFASPSVV